MEGHTSHLSQGLIRISMDLEAKTPKTPESGGAGGLGHNTPRSQEQNGENMVTYQGTKQSPDQKCMQLSTSLQPLFSGQNGEATSICTLTANM